MQGKIVSLSGYAESGKDAVADILVDCGWYKTYMSKPLELALLTLNPLIRTDPDADDERIVSRLGSVRGGSIRPYSEIHELVGYGDSKLIPEVRRLLQCLGTEIGRNMFHQDIWVNKVFDEVDEQVSQGRNVVITGIRFHNELDRVKQYNKGTRVNALPVWVARTGVGPVNTHSSDNILFRKDFVAIIENDGTLDDLRKKIIDWNSQIQGATS